MKSVTGAGCAPGAGAPAWFARQKRGLTVQSVLP